MADTILPNTLTGTASLPPTPQPAVLPTMPVGLKVPETTANLTEKNLPQEISKLQSAQQNPNTLVDFQKVMQLTSSQAYKDKQASDFATEGKAFDPTKVSGGTFASIIGNLESQRGADVGKVYAATLNAYASAQEQITNRLEFLQKLKQAQDQFKAELKLKKEQLAVDSKKNKSVYDLGIRELNQKASQWEKDFALETYKAHRIINTQNGEPAWSRQDT
ncbi:MAG: hypothetical protein WC803_12870 [Sphingomonas sp.]|jgi:hypothetical protein